MLCLARYFPTVLMSIIRDLATLEDYNACIALQKATWGETFSELVPTLILRVSQMIGGVAAGAFDPDGSLVGFVFGMTGIRNNELVHWSDMLAVRPERRSEGIGERLKQYQRERALAVGAGAMLWTFDPLQARNAHFNINHLGARPVSYEPDMYGSNTGSALHGNLPTDRFIVRWDLRNPEPGSALETDADRELTLANPLDQQGEPPTLGERLKPGPADRGYRVQIPTEFSAEKMSAEAARRWRFGIREVMQALLGQGFRVTGFRRPATGLPCYILHRTTGT